MVHKYIQKIKSFSEANKNDLYIAAIIFLVGMASFGLGRLSVLWPKKEPIRIDQVDENGQSVAIGGLDQIDQAKSSSARRSDLPASSISSFAKGKYVASKSGMAYHYPWCQGAQKIKEENKIWFQTKEGAVKAGYKPAGNCEGL